MIFRGQVRLRPAFSNKLLPHIVSAKPGEDDDNTVVEYHGQLTDALFEALSMLR